MKETATDDRPSVQSAGTRWARFLAGGTAILVFAFAVIPGLQRIGPIREMHDAVENSGIDATALFYSEIEESSEAESSIRNAIRYPARRHEARLP